MIDNDTKKQLLLSYLDTECYINELLEDKREMYEMISGVRGEGAHIIGYHSDYTERMTERIIETERLIDREIDRLCLLKELILGEIASLDDVRLRRIVHLKYICGMTFEQIADRCGYCTRQVVRLHNAALSLMFNDAATAVK